MSGLIQWLKGGRLGTGSPTPVSTEDPMPVTPVTTAGAPTFAELVDGAGVEVLGRVTASPTANTVLGRLKDLLTLQTFADAADVTQGAKADAAATDSTSSWSVIALLKGLYASLSSAAAVLTYRSDSYANITAAAPTTTTVKSGAGTLSKITFNKPVATGTVTIYDSTTGSGTVIGTITVPASPQPSTLHYDVAFATGLTIVTATAAQDITVSYR